MLYIVTALYIEAKPLISLFNLKKDNSYTKFQVFSNEDVKLIISGTGKVKSATALTYLISKEDIKKNDYIVNIGFAASNKNSQLGDIVYVSKIQNAYSDFDFYPEMIYKHNFLEGSLTTFDSIIEKKIENTEYIDMEAYGFFQTASIFFKKDKIMVLKIVSDILKDKVEDRVLVDFKNEKIDFKNCFYVTKERYNQDENIKVKINDILLTKDGTIGKVAIIDKLEKPATLNSGVFVLRPKVNNLNVTYLMHALISDDFKKFIDDIKIGATVPHLNQAALLKYKLVLPPIELQNKFAERIENIEKLKFEIEKSIETAQNLYDSLISKYFDN